MTAPILSRGRPYDDLRIGLPAPRSQLSPYLVDFNKEIPEPEPVLPGLIAAGHRVMLAADEGHGKSFLVGWIASSIVNGTNDGTYGQAIVFDAQNGARRLSKRYRSMAHGMGGEWPHVYDVGATPFDFTHSRGFEDVLEEVNSHWSKAQPVRLVAFDARDDFIGEKDVSDPQVANDFWRNVERLQEEFDPPPAVLVVVNLRKLQGGYGMAALNFITQRVSGSKRWTDLADSVLAVDAYRHEDSRRLKFLRVWASKDRDDFIPEPWWFGVESTGQGVVELSRLNRAPEMPKKEKERAEDKAYLVILKALMASPKALGWQTLVKMSGASENIAKRARDRMQEEGVVEVKGGKGLPLLVEFCGSGLSLSPASGEPESHS